MPTGLGDEQLWISATNDNTGTSTAFNDQSGNGNNGTAIGTTVVADTTNGGSYAFDLDGIDDCITTTYGPTSATSTGVFSMACWVKYDSVAANAGLMAGNAYSDRLGLSMTFDTFSSDRGHAAFLTRKLAGNYSSRIFAGDRDTTLTGQWYHVAYTGDGTTARLYVDGSEVANGLFSGFSADAWSNPLQIGRYIVVSSTADGHLDGRLDDLRFFTRTITQSEITHLAEARGIEGPPPVGLGDEKLWLCPSLNDSANDISGNGNDGTYDGGIATVADTDAGGFRAYNMSSTTTSRIALPTSVNTSFSSDSSVSIWFKYSGPLFNADPDAAFIGTGSTSGQWFHAGRTNNSGNQTGTYQSYADDGSNNGLASIASVVNEENNAWHHAVITRDYTSNESKAYVNGVLLGTSSFTSGTISTSHVHYIGYSVLSSYGYAGAATASGESLYYDDIRAYDRVLTQDEVTHLATSRGIEGGPTPPPAGGFYNPFINKTFNLNYTRRIG